MRRTLRTASYACIVPMISFVAAIQITTLIASAHGPSTQL
jgi:hypothetical protein